MEKRKNDNDKELRWTGRHAGQDKQRRNNKGIKSPLLTIMNGSSSGGETNANGKKWRNNGKQGTEGNSVRPEMILHTAEK